MKNILILFLGCLLALSCNTSKKTKTLWDLANEKKDVLKVSTIFTAHDVRDKLSTETGIDSAIQWCKDVGITRVFIESFRGYTAKREALVNAKRRFEAAGIEASGAVTPVQFGKPSSTGSIVACYTDSTTRNKLQKIMEYTASMFDTIMIDDFLFTDCECGQCIKACGKRSMSDYRCELMTEVSRENMLLPAKKVNPNVKIIIKYPQWYDDFHRRGYEVLGETGLYDIIWVGTETRDSDLSNYRRGWEVPQYGGYFIMRWMADIGKSKTGGGWFDALGTTPVNYLEQARQTVLADAREMMLFSYGGLIEETNDYGDRKGTGIADVEALKKELPGLFELAELVKNKPIKGILAPKPANSDPYLQAIKGKDFYNYNGDAYVYNIIGMMGLPLVPSEQIDTTAKAAFFPLQVLKDPAFQDKLKDMLAANKPVMITDNLAGKLGNIGFHGNLIELKTDGDLRNILKYDRGKLNSFRDKMLAPWGIKFDAPAMVAFYLIGDDIITIENFSNDPVDVKLEMKFSGEVKSRLVLPSDGVVDFKSTGKELIIQKLSSRTLVVFQY